MRTITATETDTRMGNPVHPGNLSRPRFWSRTGCRSRRPRRPSASRASRSQASLNGRANLSGDMALRVEKAFGVRMETLMRMQSSYDIVQTRQRAKSITVRRYRRRAA